MDDDRKLQILFFTIACLAVVALVGVWENFIEPVFTVITNSINITI